ncbi:MAG: DUF3488 domain-containing protein [Eggerthellaceae bacterium]|nr:DUF3488 domain-containing protein [Eggerthellaceae bacterium]
MKKFVAFIVPVKAFAAYIFAGLMCLYMAAGALYATAWADPAFAFNIPFVFVIEGAVLSLLIALLWAAIFNEKANQKRRWFPRLILFSVLLFALLAVCLLVFVAMPTNEAKLWLAVAGFFVCCTILVSILVEAYYKVTGKRYTEILKEYQARQGSGQ